MGMGSATGWQPTAQGRERGDKEETAKSTQLLNCTDVNNQVFLCVLPHRMTVLTSQDQAENYSANDNKGICELA